MAVWFSGVWAARYLSRGQQRLRPTGWHQSQNIIGAKLRDDNVCGHAHHAARKARFFPRNRHTARARRTIIETGDRRKKMTEQERARERRDTYMSATCGPAWRFA
ncbi:hypothetical protein [Paraburkholderia sp. WP4_3_2]|nr:hypothetical protein [Paraburkholderia sp. WP4_3_2]